ncbi:MAG: MBL fold metallo-hydrolase [Lachnospiraceae bacterium]|nr:MBL fold metallo-hydrolase [Lachnospiraceae bacterium]
MRLELYVVGPVQTNCYFVINEETNEMIVVDPGSSGKALAQKAKESGYEPKAIILTHGHFDHCNGIEDFLSEYDIPVYTYEGERETMENPIYNLSGDMGGEGCSYHVDYYLKDEQELDIAGFHFRVLATPGHTLGGCCFYFPYEDTLFSGDTLFQYSVGRTDFPGGSMSTLVHAIKEKLMVLPEKTTVYPGHGDATTIEFERMNNPYL